MSAWWQVTVWEAINPRPTAASQWAQSRGSGLGIGSHVGCRCIVISESSRFTNHLVPSCYATWFTVMGALLQTLVSSFFPVIALWFSCFRCGVHLLTFIWTVPPPPSVMEQMSQCLMVPACHPITLFPLVGGRQRRCCWFIEGAACPVAKLPWEGGNKWPHFPEWIFRKHSG